MTACITAINSIDSSLLIEDLPRVKC